MSGAFHLGMLIIAAIVLAGIYIAGSRLDSDVLHTAAICGAVGVLITAFMASDLRHS